jgi:WD40 repeat protein
LKSSAIAYSPDNRVLAIVRGSNVIQLLDAESLSEIARLEAPDPQGIAHLAFSPDGGRLAVVATTHVVHLWDLRRLRSRLAGFSLDWDHPPIPIEVKRDRELQVRVKGK